MRLLWCLRDQWYRKGAGLGGGCDDRRSWVKSGGGVGLGVRE